jgi:hypothetical protein
VRRFFFGSGAPLGALLLLSLSPRVAAAPPAVSIGIVPPYVEKVVAGASSVSDSIAFLNRGTDPVVVSVDLADFGVDPAGAVSEQPPGSQPASLVPYLRITPASVRVAPSQEVFFRYAIETPPAFKQLRAMIYFSSRPEVPARPNQVVVVARMGVPVYVESRDAKPASLIVEDVRWARTGEAGDSLTLEMRASNEGERNIRPTGYVLVRSSDGKFDRSYAFNEGREPVLPGQKRQWGMSFGPVPAGDVTVRLRFATSPRTSYETKTWIPANGG